MITFTLRMRFDEGPRDEALLVLRSLVGPVRAQPGCTETRLMNDVQATDVITWMSRWREQPDLDRHLQSHHFRRILAVMELAAERPDIEFDSGTELRGFELIAEVVGGNADLRSPELERPTENPNRGDLLHHEEH